MRPPACSWVFLSTAAGYEAGRFVDSLPPLPVVPASNATYFVADVLGNATFAFNTTNELTWDPKANKTATEFTLNIQDNQDGTFGYSLYITGERAFGLGTGAPCRQCHGAGHLKKHPPHVPHMSLVFPTHLPSSPCPLFLRRAFLVPLQPTLSMPQQSALFSRTAATTSPSSTLCPPISMPPTLGATTTVSAVADLI